MTRYSPRTVLKVAVDTLYTQMGSGIHLVVGPNYMAPRLRILSVDQTQKNKTPRRRRKTKNHPVMTKRRLRWKKRQRWWRKRWWGERWWRKRNLTTTSVYVYERPMLQRREGDFVFGECHDIDM